MKTLLGILGTIVFNLLVILIINTFGYIGVLEIIVLFITEAIIMLLFTVIKYNI